MKKVIFFLLILPLFFPTVKAQDTVLIFHPTSSNIKTVHYLYSNKMFPAQDHKLFFQGVYHKDEAYNYSASRELLNQNDEYLNFGLVEIIQDIDNKSLFGPNGMSHELKKLFKSSVASFFFGGPDIPPIVYNEPVNLLTSVSDTYRHYLEASAMYHLLGNYSKSEPWLEKHPDYIILGICLGMQTMNVGTGGSLIQDIPTEVYAISSHEDAVEAGTKMHRNYHYDNPNDGIQQSSYHFHRVKPSEADSRPFDISFEENPYVLSSHHQAIKKTGKGIYPLAYSSDGEIIEAIGHAEYKNVLGIQFHPERTYLYKEPSVFHISQDSTLNYKHFLESNDSYRFHEDFWMKIGKVLSEGKE